MEEWEEELAEVRAMTEREMEDLVTEDDAPVDNILSEKQQRLLTEPLYAAWTDPPACAPDHRPFLAMANVGLFHALRQPPVVPDVMLALDIPGLGPDLSLKANRSYFVWVQDGKPPRVAIEIVSNREGGEEEEKRRKYAVIGIEYYVIFDPWRRLSDRILRIHQFHGLSHGYIEQVGGILEPVGLGLTLWQGKYEGEEGLWLRWTTRDGQLISTGAELAAHERQRAIEAEQRMTQEQQRAIEAEQRAEQLIARLRALGIEP
jgi:Uma2 family endonuclease